MSHADEGSLRALLDDELEETEAGAIRAHVASCRDCAAELRRADETDLLTTALLDAADVAPPTERVRARLTELRAARAPTGGARRAGVRRIVWIGCGDLARAALLLLAFSGAVAAAVHPASPLRRWIADEPPAAATAPAVEAPAATAAPATEVGVRVSVANVMRITLTRVPAGAPVEVSWVDENMAAVYAPEGTTFTTSDAEGRIEAVLEPGAVRIELPRRALQAALAVNGTVYLEKTGERIDYPGAPAFVEGARVRFQVR